MKRTKKHHFAHVDPEKIVAPAVSANKGETISAPPTSLGNPVIRRDLIKTVVVIIVFVAAIIAFLIIQQKTDLLKPVLRLFGL